MRLVHEFHFLTSAACREQELVIQKTQARMTRSPDQDKRGASVLDVLSLLSVLAQPFNAHLINPFPPFTTFALI